MNRLADKIKDVAKKEATAPPWFLAGSVLVSLAALSYQMWTAQGRDDQARDAAARTEERIQTGLRRTFDRILADEDKYSEDRRKDRQEMIDAIRHEAELECRTIPRCK